MSIGSEWDNSPTALKKPHPVRLFPSNQRKIREPQTLLHQSSVMGPVSVQAQFFAGLFHPFCDAASSSRRGSSCVKRSFITNANAPLS